MTQNAGVVEVEIDGADAGGELVRAALGDLIFYLRDVPGVRVSTASQPVPGSKGVATDLIIAAGTSGAISALVEVFHLWLRRDKRRALTITQRLGGDGLVTKIEGENISLDSIEAAVKAVWGTGQE
jgi:hypothetical protein